MKINSIFLIICLFIGVQGLYSGERADIVTFDEKFNISDEEFKLSMNIDAGDVRVLRNDESNVCHVLIEYNKERCDLDVRFNEKRNELEVGIDIDDISFLHKENHDDNWKVDVTIELPYKPPISLDADIKAGEMRFDIGDIHLHNFELSNWAGEVKVDFDKPNCMEMDIFDVNVHVGETRLLNLCNAHLSEAIINGGIGEMTIDFNGKLTTRTMARIDLDIGETTLILPQDMGVKMKVTKFLFLSEMEYPTWFEKRGRYFYSENYKDNENSLYLDISTGIGELNIHLE
jgi:hypothetical protein